MIGGTSEAKTNFDDVIDKITKNKSTDALKMTWTWYVVLMSGLFEVVVWHQSIVKENQEFGTRKKLPWFPGNDTKYNYLFTKTELLLRLAQMQAALDVSSERF